MEVSTISKSDYLKKLGFDKDPFQYYNADQEENLEQYFVDPPYFGSLWGDPEHPQSHIVFAPRGAGKSAQRRMLESKALRENVFTITYDLFPISAQNLDQADLNFHIRNLNRLALMTFFTHAANSDVPPHMLFHSSERSILTKLVDLYLGDTDMFTFKGAVQQIVTIPAKLKKFWNDNLPAIGMISVFLKARFGLNAAGTSSFDASQQSLAAASGDPLTHFYMILSLVPKVGLSSCYVLVDKVDEPSFANNNPPIAFKLVQALLTDLRFINSTDFGVKFFLWESLEPFYQKYARPDRVQQYRLRWRYQELVTMINRRLAAYSSNRVTSLSDIVDISGVDPYLLVIAFSNNSPRNLIEMLDDIVDEHLRLHPDGGGRVDMQSIDRGIKKFCYDKAEPLYGPAMIQDLKRISRVGFTTNFLSNDLYKSPETARRRIQIWEDKGVIKHVCDLPSTRRGRPFSYYLIQDAILVPLVMESRPVADLIKDMAVPCGNCDRVYMLHIDHFSDESVPLCPNCNSRLL